MTPDPSMKSMFRRKAILWSLLWIVALTGIWMAAGRADRAFESYMQQGVSSLAAACDLLPADADVFACNVNFREDWRNLRASKFYPALRELSPIKPVLEEWKLGEEDLTLAEKWFLRFWGPEVAVAFSRENGTLYLLTPLGSRYACVKWLAEMMFRPSGNGAPGTLRHEGGHWWIAVTDDHLCPRGFHVELAPVRGVAVLAISRKPDPLAPVFRLAANPQSGLGQSPNFHDFLRDGMEHANHSFGFVRLRGRGQPPESFGIRWKIWTQPASDGPRSLQALVQVPARCVEGSSSQIPNAANLIRLRQPDDIICLVTSREDIQAAWKGCLHHLPSAWTNLISKVTPDRLPEAFRSIWQPIFDKLGKEIFVGLGESSLLSDRYRVPFPRTVVAIPFDDTPVFVRALEDTVLKCNQDFKANLLIRKVVRPQGEYYYVRMGDSSWKYRYGLSSLPVFAFAGGLLLAAPDTSTMEKALERLADPASAATAPVEGAAVFANLQRAPQTARALLTCAGALLDPGENAFLTPAQMKNMDELFNLLEQFSEARADITRTPGVYQLRLGLQPQP